MIGCPANVLYSNPGKHRDQEDAAGGYPEQGERSRRGEDQDGNQDKREQECCTTTRMFDREFCNGFRGKLGTSAS